ncbi:VWA domain-containing protein [Uliginosibacterium sp. H1]|uniref:VWA domain-containing protein n=1 Tax=Uliginosibacterium sp. H1 TaxID=3114757 RepID=UPI002E186883|nr:VWA domain-containing protein [Uliginosibacterium sp. H1]
MDVVDINLAAFHFLRPLWLLLVPAALLLLWLWRRATDQRRRWRDVIAPHLLERMLVSDAAGWRLRPAHLVAASLCVIGVAAAGPTWQKEPPPFTDDKAPMIVALDLSRSMDATDIPPTRLERSKQKVRDLMKLRAGSRTGLVVYAGTAHMVLPPAEDPALMELFLAALDTRMMPRSGKNARAALDEAERLLRKETAAGTVVFITDGFDQAQIAGFARQVQASRHQVLVLAAGTEQGGPIRTPDGRVALDAGGRPVQGTFDGAALRRLSDEADVPLASLTLDEDDVEWVQRRARRHMEEAQEKDAEVRWREFGYYLCFPIALLAALGFRRGWVLRWTACLLLGIALAQPQPAWAADGSAAATQVKQWFMDALLTPDQQGRWHFEHGNYPAAAAHFRDPMWQGRAYYRAGDYNAALTAFARLDSAEAFFMMGNCYAQLHLYPQSIVAYDHALAARATFPEASANRKLVASLIPKEKKDDGGEEGPDLPPDQIKFDNKDGKGKEKQVDMAALRKQSAELWMRNLKVSPADFLRQKFQIEAARPEPRTPTPPAGGVKP